MTVLEHEAVTPPIEDTVTEIQAELDSLATRLARSHLNIMKARGTLLPLLRDPETYEAQLVKAQRYYAAATDATATISYAGEWLLDNFYIVQQAFRQIGEDLPAPFYAELPKLADGELKGYVRAYAIAREITAWAVNPLTFEQIQMFVVAYQDVAPLTMGELWALPALLRVVNLENLIWTLGQLTGDSESAHIFAPEAAPTHTADESHVANAILNLRMLGTQDWKAFFEAVSRVEQMLRTDPAGVYPHMDFATRNYYRQRIERLSPDTPADEERVASTAIRLAAAAADRVGTHDRTAHVGYYLCDAGVAQLRRETQLRPRLRDRIESFRQATPMPLYLAAVVTITVAVLAVLGVALSITGTSGFWLLVALVLALLPASTIAVNVTNWLITHLVPPTFLPKMDFSDGIPADCRTMVVIPAMLVSDAETQSLVDQLEMHALRGHDAHLTYALLLDYADADEAVTPDDAALLDTARQAIKGLNARHGRDGVQPFYLFVRERRWNEAEGVWMGWERKRGKLHEFNALLLDPAAETSYTVRDGDLSVLPSIRFVITLDADTVLPDESAQRLVGTLAHPLNRPLFDANCNVTAGYTVLQPRIEIAPSSGNRTVFTRIFAGDTGYDLYTLAVSDAYQDWFGEGIFTGKGIYDVAAFERSLDGCTPENAILSHDLFEGIHGRAGLVTDVVLLEDYPSQYLVHTRRMHRWIRGDWQLLPWLGRRVPMADGTPAPTRFSVLDRWKLLDNLRRSLVAPALLAFFVVGWMFLPTPPALWLVAALALTASPLLISAFNIIMQGVSGGTWANAGQQLSTTGLRWWLSLAFLPHEAFLSIDAIVRTLYRLRVRKHMLQWTTAAATQRQFGNGGLLMAWGELGGTTLFTAVLAAVLAVVNPPALAAGLPLLILWFMSPVVADILSRPITRKSVSLSDEQRETVRALARRTWLFFEHFIGPDDHWLPPDHYQESPRGTVAHQTSPTNIGLGLLSVLAAYDLGYVGLMELSARLQLTFDNLDTLERYRGHFLNWYDTRMMTPLPPAYVSTVDSGNLACCLLTLKSGLRELPGKQIMRPQRWDGIADTLAVLSETLATMTAASATGDTADLRARITAVREQVAAVRHDPTARILYLRELSSTIWPDFTRSMLAILERQRNSLDVELLSSLRVYAERISHQLGQMERTVGLLLPWIPLMAEPPTLLAQAERHPVLFAAWTSLRALLPPMPLLGDMPTLCREGGALTLRLAAQIRAIEANEADREAALSWCDTLREALDTTCATCETLLTDFARLETRIDSYLNAMDFTFLFDRQRKLFHIGYNLASERLDANYYDLLASEARLASLFAIATRQVPQEHWLKLSRPQTRVDNVPALLSWSGTMFEYLMPLLLTRTYPGTLLEQSYEAVVQAHIDYGRKNNVPWGISESGYFAFDGSQNYQYRAFGVPSLAYKRGMAADMVIAPYASALALPINPPAVLENFKALANIKALGRYGFYEAIDFTRSRLELGNDRAIVREYMAHHQGMTLLTLANMLTDNAMVRRFHADARVQAIELLLQEQIPSSIEFEYPSPDSESLEGTAQPQLNASPWTAQIGAPTPVVHFLSNGRYGVLLTEAGSGYSQWNAAALTRWRSDTTLDNWGTWIYVRDQDSGALWSAAHHPLRAAPETENVVFSPHKAHYMRRDHDVSMETEITVPPDDDIEIRRVRLTNQSDAPRRLMLCSYAEVVLGSQDGDRRHPAFSKLFVESEYVPEVNGLLFRRRPRSANDAELYMLHMLVTATPSDVPPQYETDRARFLGRNRTATTPEALLNGGTLSGTTGGTLDPVMALGREVELQPHESASLAFITIAANSRAGVLALARSYQAWSAVDRAFEHARYRSELEMRQLDIHSPDIQLYQRMLSALLYPQAALRAAPHVIAANRKGQNGLWAHGISGDYPIIVVRIGDETETAVLRELVQAHRYWRSRQIKTTLVVLNQRDTGYTQELYNQVHRLIVRMGSETWINRHDGIFLLRADLLTEADTALLAASARVWLEGKDGPLARQLHAATRQPVYLPPFTPTLDADHYTGMASVARPDNLIFDNGFGGFSPDGTEYVIYRDGETMPPAPWSNVIANPDFGFTVSESGAGYTWAGNSSENRLTTWRNDPVTDMPSEIVYLRDEETAQVWTTTPLPTPTGAAVLVRHGHGYTSFEQHSHSLKQMMTLFAAPDAPVKIVRLRLENTADRVRRITATYYAEWVLGTAKDITQAYIIPEYDAAQQTLLFRNPYSIEFGSQFAFITASQDFHGLTTDRTEFLGRLNSYRYPAALGRIGLAGTVQAGNDPCAAVQIHLDIQPGEAEDVYFVLGAGDSRDAALTLARTYRDAAQVQAAWDAARSFWRDYTSQITVRTPDAALNTILPWLAYQTLSCRIWGRSALYQSGGAFGFRDQLQDVMQTIHAQPQIAREHILRAARHQFDAGDVLHWWHPPSGRGVRTRFSDDLVWLPLVTAYYVRATGDAAILNEKVPFLTGEPLKPDEEERYGLYEPGSETLTIYEHCRRALNKAATSGKHGLPLMGIGDWNDGMSRVGVHGKGESVWMGWFLYAALDSFLPMAEASGDTAYAAQLRARMEALRTALEAHAWDGGWYLRAFYDDGTPLGSAQNAECRIDSISQSWAVISKAGDPARARQAMSAVKTHLVDPDHDLILLFTPPFDKTEKDPGYIKGYPPGIRENGGQYTHAAIWTAWAFADMGDGDEAGRLFGFLNPITDADTPERAQRYRVEPYVVAADVYGVPPHKGRGGWTWYTGSSGWLYRLAVERLLGLRREGDALVLAPCIPTTWPSYEVIYRYGQATYHIRVDNPSGVSSGVAQVTMDSAVLDSARVPLVDEPRTITVVVTLGT